MYPKCFLQIVLLELVLDYNTETERNTDKSKIVTYRALLHNNATFAYKIYPKKLNKNKPTTKIGNKIVISYSGGTDTRIRSRYL